MQSRKVIKWLWIILLSPFALLFFMLLITSLGIFGKMPSFEELENPKSNIATEIYSEDGQMIGEFFVQNRSFVDYADLFPEERSKLLVMKGDSVPAIVAALVSTEDVRFNTHSGVDLQSLGRVAVKTIAFGDTGQGGGSTITQQVAKNLFPRDTVSRSSMGRKSKLVVSKFKEWITSVKLEYNYTKEELTAMYLNTVEYGSNAFGIKSAARTFFNKLPEDVEIQEAAVLVGVVNAPTKYSPVLNYERAVTRRNTVLARMVDNKCITKAQYDSLSALPITLNYRPVSHNEGTGTYFREMLRLVMNMERPKRNQFYTDWDYKQAVKQWDENPLYGWCHKNKKADGTPYNIYRDGLKIYTTINASMQKFAEEAVQKQMETVIQPRMDAQWRNSKVLFQQTSKADAEKIVTRAMKLSDRYRILAREGMSEEEILKTFDVPTRMRVFTYKGDRDTTITPRDSILHHKRILRASFVAIEPGTGYVRAYVGGPNFRYFKYDMAKQAKRQVGSTTKPFVYTFAIDHLGMAPCTKVPNLQVTIETPNGKPWTPKEAGRVTYDGELHELNWGLALSRNNYSAWIMKQAKQPSSVADFINNMGIKSYIDPVYALCLGSYESSLFELVGAYTTFTNKGVFLDPIFVTRIEDRQGNVLASFMADSHDAISEQTAYTMLGMLQRVVSGGTANRLKWQHGVTGEVGGKTGTTQRNRDGWFVCVAPKIVCGAWVGGEDQQVHLSIAGEGGVVALPIVGDFLSKVYKEPRLGVNLTDTFAVPERMPSYNCGDYAEYDSGGVDLDDEFFE